MNLSNNKNILKDILKIVLTFIITLVILMTALVIVNLIPRKCIENNAKESLPIFLEEGNFPKLKYAYNFLLDNYTDALMINTALSVDSTKPIESTILMRRGYRANEGLELKEAGTNDIPIKSLEENINETNTTYFQYQRYWHGYMIFLRPLLVLFNYTQIRIILIATFIMLSLILVYLTYKKINIYICIATIFMLLISSFIFIGMSIQYSSVFIIMLISSIYIIMKCKEYNNIKILNVFFIIGILTSFFDLLTAPLLTFRNTGSLLYDFKNESE